jgi:UDP-N-acetylmuramyl pentapeptide phosphotransferase/UDP-N-acetylglucosamine-1-phosphate transferase
MLVGVEDDLLTVSPRKKLLMQVIVGSVLCYAGFRIESLYGLFGVGAIGLELSCVLTILFLITLINAFNLIDGIDGLAGSLVMVSSTIFGLLFYLEGAFDYSVLALALSASILAFLHFNFHKASIFMGDNGSMILGLIIAVFSIQLLNFSGDKIASVNGLALVFSLIAIPVLDLARVSLVRMLRGKSPFSADRNHIHHVFLRQGYSTPVICLTLIIMEMVLVGIALNLHAMNPTVQILILTTTFGMMITGFHSFKKVIDFSLKENWN